MLSSDLDRATDTARVICQYQLGSGVSLEPIQTIKLREQCSGCGSSSALTEQAESTASMKTRVNGFLREHILPVMADPTQSRGAVVAVVGHGVILQVVWSCLADLFDSQSFHLAQGADLGADYMHPVWSNTGIMELDIRPGGPPTEMLTPSAVVTNVDPPWLTKSVPPTPPGGCAPLMGWSVTILAVDSTLHLSGHALAQTVPEAKQASKQQPADDFYRLTGNV